MPPLFSMYSVLSKRFCRLSMTILLLVFFSAVAGVFHTAPLTATATSAFFSFFDFGVYYRSED